MKRTHITVRLDGGQVVRISNQAKKEKRTFSQMLRVLLDKVLG